MTEFEKLAAELEVLAKAQPATQEDKVLAAAKEAGVDTDQIGDVPESDEDKAMDDAGEPDGDEDEDDEVLGKSFKVIGGEGAPVKAYDATDLIKSLNDKVSCLESDKEHLGKSLEVIADLLKSQEAQIETLQKAMVNMSKQGVGRRAVLTVSERPEVALTKSVQQSNAMNPETFMMKANSAFDAGRITGKDLTTCSVSLRIGEAIDANLINKIFAE